jgi:DNA-binding response OmpR family regulator
MNVRVLLVEDEPAVAMTVSDLLAGEGYDVETAADGRAGLARASSEAFDVVLLDVMLPGMDGFEVCRRIRATPDGGSLPILMITARGEDVDRIVGLELGADDYITKPFSPRKLVERINAILGHGTSRQRMQA